MYHICSATERLGEAINSLEKTENPEHRLPAWIQVLTTLQTVQQE